MDRDKSRKDDVTAAARQARRSFLAHSANKGGKVDLLADHLTGVARRAAEHAGSFAAAEAHLAGLLHDLGKYGDRFQRRLQGQEAGIDHWSAGAWVAIRQYRSVAAAMAVEGHHLGLRTASKGALADLNPERLLKNHPLSLRLSADNTDVLLERMRRDIEGPAQPATSLYGPAIQESAAAMLDIRMLFSALVDADFLETEAHFEAGQDGQKVYRPAGPELKPSEALSVLADYVAGLPRHSSEEVARLRNDLATACRDAAGLGVGLFTLSAPTGSGKTLAMLAFALRHAFEHGLRRVVVVIPYLSIIEQTARKYCEVLGERFGEHYILEHHSLAGTRTEGARDDGADQDNEDQARRTARLLSENWDAPVILTTSVQFLESLFANRPAACRKLHRLAQSVILFDEVQTLPPQLAPATLATLAHLSQRYGSTVVFATATQPAFPCLEKEVCALGGHGWRPQEIASPAMDLFLLAKRTHVLWPDLKKPTPWDEIADQLARPECERVLCIVNLKRHAQTLLKMLKDRGAESLFHLSTSMCPAHRVARLAEIRQRLDEGRPCRLVATQCVEAGVDVDFPIVYRAFGPLEAIAQAAGRCNRNGNLPQRGEVHVFLPDESDETRAYPPGIYGQAAGVTRILLQARGPAGMDIDDPNLFEKYYRTFYDLTRAASIKQGKARKLAEAIRDQDFAEVARLYRLIPKNGINVLVPYDPVAYHELAEQVRAAVLNGKWIKRAQPHVVSLFRPNEGLPIWTYLESVCLGRHDWSDEWFIYLKEEHYDRQLMGLVPPESQELLSD